MPLRKPATAARGVVPLQPEPGLDELVAAARACRLCAPQLPFGARPVLQAARGARLLVVGQAPGAKVHASGIPWCDASGDRLRAWLDIDPDTFYDPRRVAIVPVGLCYPGRAASGDAPPRRECAPLWLDRVRAALPQVELTLLVGRHAQAHVLRDPSSGRAPTSLGAVLHDWRRQAPRVFPLPHPSPRNIVWFQQNPWFERELLPVLRDAVRRLVQHRAA
jgi:uracil-DNA glycosylase